MSARVYVPLSHVWIHVTEHSVPTVFDFLFNLFWNVHRLHIRTPTAGDFQINFFFWFSVVGWWTSLESFWEKIFLLFVTLIGGGSKVKCFFSLPAPLMNWTEFESIEKLLWPGAVNHSRIQTSAKLWGVAHQTRALSASQNSTDSKWRHTERVVVSSQ